MRCIHTPTRSLRRGAPCGRRIQLTGRRITEDTSVRGWSSSGVGVSYARPHGHASRTETGGRTLGVGHCVQGMSEGKEVIRRRQTKLAINGETAADKARVRSSHGQACPVEPPRNDGRSQTSGSPRRTQLLEGPKGPRVRRFATSLWIHPTIIDRGVRTGRALRTRTARLRCARGSRNTTASPRTAPVPATLEGRPRSPEGALLNTSWRPLGQRAQCGYAGLA